MNYFQRHPRLATILAVLFGGAVTALLYLLSVINPAPDQHAPGTVAATAAQYQPGAAVSAPDAAGGEGYLGMVELAEGQAVERVEQVDADGDGTGEVLVAVRGGGDERLLDWYLFQAVGGEYRLLLARKQLALGEVSSEGGRLVESEALFADGDEPCCPSQHRLTYFSWQDGALVESHSETAPGAAPTP